MKILKFGMLNVLMGFAALLPLEAVADDEQALLLPGISGMESIDGISGLIPIGFFGWCQFENTGVQGS